MHAGSLPARSLGTRPGQGSSLVSFSEIDLSKPGDAASAGILFTFPSKAVWPWVPTSETGSYYIYISNIYHIIIHHVIIDYLGCVSSLASSNVRMGFGTSFRQWTSDISTGPASKSHPVWDRCDTNVPLSPNFLLSQSSLSCDNKTSNHSNHQSVICVQAHWPDCSSNYVQSEHQPPHVTC